MGLPAKRTTSTKRDLRRSHHAVSAVWAGKCSRCGNSILPHKACGNCGFYKGKEVINVLAKLDKKEKKKREKELAQQEKTHAHKKEGKEKE
ncbi:50S ribosomal protein L32 [Candidatus Azambacteria bacterium]|nr:50S ribosomal protein L32 [Candidatus Azambacteria bacterium]